MELFQYCQVCLITDVKMYDMKAAPNDTFGVIYTHLIDIPKFVGDHYVCYECAALLHKYQDFKSKCLKAYHILTEFAIDQRNITKQELKLSRKKGKLESHLFISPINVDDGIECYDSKEVLGNDTNNIFQKKSLSFPQAIDAKLIPDYIKGKLYDDIENIKVDVEDVVKIEEHNVNSDFNAPFDFREDMLTDNNDSPEENLPEKPLQLQCKRKKIKEPKTKKRKKIKTVIKSEDDFSDNEPLSKCIAIDKYKKISIKTGNDLSYFEDYATIVLLTPEEARKEVLLRKESNNYINSAFKCDFCFRGYEVKSAFDNHMKKHSVNEYESDTSRPSSPIIIEGTPEKRVLLPSHAHKLCDGKRNIPRVNTEQCYSQPIEATHKIIVTEHGSYKCDLCHLRFSQSIYLCKHRLACHKRKFICKLCPYICFCTVQAKAHVSLHKGKKYPCKICGEIFSMQNSLYMHKRMKHLQESVSESVCEHCGSIFGTERGLFLHNYKVHSQDKNDKLGPECKECGVHFSTEAAWKRHLVLSSKHTVSNGCKYCGETFSMMADLKLHMRVHARKHFKICDNVKLPAACTMCDKWLSDRTEYKTHITSEHPQCDDAKKIVAEHQTPYVCEVCGQTFKQQCYLTYHQRKHTGERPYKCKLCDKSFQLSGALAVHSATHDRVREHECHMCARVFTFKSALNKHIKMHLGIRPHKCAICDKGFIHMCDLKLHIKYVHDKVPWPKKKSKRTNEDNQLLY